MNDLLHAVDSANASRSQLTRFARFVEGRTGKTFAHYDALHTFSIEQPARFWELFLEHAGALCAGEVTPSLVGDDIETARFFPHLRISWVGSARRTKSAPKHSSDATNPVRASRCLEPSFASG
jgi:acetoacetyl-CoA synthetase